MRDGSDVEPRNAPSRSVDMFLDLAATEEDHMDVSCSSINVL